MLLCSLNPTSLPPGPGRPRWVNPSQLSELVYLGWGKRDFSQSPIPQHRNPGWSYYIVRNGSVRVCVDKEEHLVSSPKCLLAGPRCSYGLRHEPGEQCDILVWIFRSTSKNSDLGHAADAYRIVDLGATSLQFIEHLHSQSREEITRQREFFDASLMHIRDLLDIQLVRSLGGIREESTEERRAGLAYEWMLNNLELSDPVRSLCDYLQISQSTLQRLCRNHFEMSPGALHRRLRLVEARRLIVEDGWQVKQAAYRLGYRYPNDLSRALSREFGQEGRCIAATDKT